MTLLPLFVSVFACAQSAGSETEEFETDKGCFAFRDRVLDQGWHEMPRGEEICDGPIGVAEGECAPNFELPDQDNELIALSQYRGRVTVLSTAGTW
jgi:cytochrome oxidase Cu insertion factor (SCO1/SenC/PrrC family)